MGLVMTTSINVQMPSMIEQCRLANKKNEKKATEERGFAPTKQSCTFHNGHKNIPNNSLTMGVGEEVDRHKV
jgi:hypothetical protein